MHLVIKQANKNVFACLIVAILLVIASLTPFIGHAQTTSSPVPVQANGTCANGNPPQDGLCYSSVTAPPVTQADCVPGTTLVNGVCSSPPPAGGSCPSGSTLQNGVCVSSSSGGNQGWSCSSIGSCIAGIVYLVPSLSAFIAYIAAYFFDVIAQLSLQSSAYSLGFLSTGWQAALSIANMAILFILIFIAITIMFQAETGGTMRMLGTLIVVALLVNFSFFFTRVIIDAGNLLAVQFYNALNLPAFNPPAFLTGLGNGVLNNGNSGGPVVGDLTARIMNAVNLQSLFGNPDFQAFSTQNNSSIVGNLNQLITLSFLYIAVAAIYWILIFTFMFAGVKFLLRIVTLWFVLIASPVAFAFAALASGNGPAKKIWGMWQSALVQYSIYPAVFFFIFYIVGTTITDIGGSSGIYSQIFGQGTGASATSIVDSVASVAVYMSIIIAMVYFAMKGADMVAAQGNQFAGKIAGGASSFVSNRVNNLAGFAGRQTLGRGFTKLSQNEGFNEKTAQMSQSKNFLISQTGKRLNQGVNAAASGSYDVRAPIIAATSRVDKQAGARLANLIGTPREGFKPQQEKAQERADKAEQARKDARSAQLKKTIQKKRKEHVDAHIEKIESDENIAEVVKRREDAARLGGSLNAKDEKIYQDAMSAEIKKVKTKEPNLTDDEAQKKVEAEKKVSGWGPSKEDIKFVQKEMNKEDVEARSIDKLKSIAQFLGNKQKEVVEKSETIKPEDKEAILNKYHNSTDNDSPFANANRLVVEARKTNRELHAENLGNKKIEELLQQGQVIDKAAMASLKFELKKMQITADRQYKTLQKSGATEEILAKADENKGKVRELRTHIENLDQERKKEPEHGGGVPEKEAFKIVAPDA